MNSCKSSSVGDIPGLRWFHNSSANSRSSARYVPNLREEESGLSLWLESWKIFSKRSNMPPRCALLSSGVMSFKSVPSSLRRGSMSSPSTNSPFSQLPCSRGSNKVFGSWCSSATTSLSAYPPNSGDICL